MNQLSDPIAVFDSGMGGISVLREMTKLMPNEDFIYYGDSKHAPYGTKTLEEVRALTIEHITYLIKEKHAKAVAVACNTATSAAVRILRDMYPDLPLVGVEPAIKPAVLATGHAKVVVMATPMTLREEKFHKLESLYDEQADIYPLPCPGLMEFVEQGILSGEKLETFLHNLLDPYKDKDITGIVLGCTHYPFLKETIQKMLAKADPLLATLPLFLSSDKGYQKTTRKLFLEVYSSLDYHYSEWIHIGDNKFADDTQPSRLGIHTQPVSVPELDDYEKHMAAYIEEYGMHSVVKLFRNFRLEEHTDKETFAYKYASLYFVPYVHWAVHDALKRGYKTLYFISRDGYYLKLMADAVIESKGLPLRTKYIYGSRKAWRVPSFIDKVDEEFFEPYGNFSGVRNFNKLLSALLIDEATFDKFFPELGYLKTTKRYSDQLISDVSQKLKRSDAYKEHLLAVAKKQRVIVSDYLRQEINFDEPFAFVEYWGRGYTQDCLTRLLADAAGHEVDDPMYYVRSIYPTIGKSIRYNYTCNTHSVVFAESIFANLPYRTIETYEEKNGRIEPVFNSCENDEEMNQALKTYLVRFAKDFCALNLEDEFTTGHYLYDFGMANFKQTTDDPILLNVFGSLKDAVALGERAEEYAPPVTFRTIVDWMHGKSYHTKSFEMSMKKSKFIYRWIYKSYCYYCDNIRGKIFKNKY